MPNRYATRVRSDELVSLLRQEILAADGANGSTLVALRADAFAYYFGERPLPEAEGRSAVVSTDVADMIEAVVSQILPGFSGDNVVEIEPENDSDVEQAQTESDILNDVILEQNRGYVFFQEALRDALLLRNGWVKCWQDEVDSVSRQTIPGEVSEDDVAAIVALLEEGPAVKSVKAERGDQGVDLVVTKTRRRMRVGAVDPTSILFQADWDSVFLDGIRFFAERSFPTRGELVADGYSKAEIEDLGHGQVTEPVPGDQNARYSRPGGANAGGPSAMPSNLPWAVQPIEHYVCYYTYDSDGDGVAELHRICLAGGSTILKDEVVDFIPYGTGTPFLQPHQLNGLGLFDKIKSVQDVKTASLRKWINNLEAANNSRVAVNERTVNLTDAMNTRPGGIVRVKGSPAAELVPFPVVDTGASNNALMAYADKMRSERGGASLDMQSAAAQVGSNASGVAVDREYSSKEQMAAMICRTLAETLVRSTYAIVHRGLRTWFKEEVSARVRGQFVKSNPAQWPERYRINVKSGLSIAERVQKKTALEQVIAQQQNILERGLGGQLTDMPAVYRATLDWTRAAALDNGERYFVDPESKPAQEAKAAADGAAKAQAEQQLKLQDQIASSERQVAAMKSAIDKYKADTDAGFKYFDAVLSAQVEAMKLGQAAAVVAVAALSAEGNEDSEEYQDGVNGSPEGGNSGVDPNESDRRAG